MTTTSTTASTTEPPGRFVLGSWTVDPGLDRLERGEDLVTLEPRAMDLLACLARHAGETVSKDRILHEVWADAAVVEGVIPKTISTVRAALGDDAAAPTYILTAPRRGYRLVAAVRWLDSPGQTHPTTSAAATTPSPDPSPGPSPLGTRGAEARARVVAAVALAVLVIAGVTVRWIGQTDRRIGQTDVEVPPESSVSSTLPASLQNLLLEARHLWSQREADSVRRANELLLEAAREAPDSAEVQGWLALSFVTRGNYLGSMAESLESAQVHAELALALDPESAIAHCARGALAITDDRDPQLAVQHFSQAVALEPDLLPARQFLAEALSIAGRDAEALATIDEAIRIEPLSAVLHGVRGLVLLRDERLVAALDAFDRALVFEPKFTWINRNRAWTLARLGRESQACEAFYLEAKGNGEAPEHLASMRAAIESAGLAGYWAWRLGRLESVRARGITLRPMQYAEALAGVGRDAEALIELARAAATPDGEFFFYFRDSTAFDRLRADPRFLATYAPFESE